MKLVHWASNVCENPGTYPQSTSVRHPVTCKGSSDQAQAAVVAVYYLVSEQSPERLEKALIDPLERLLIALPRVSRVTSTAGEGDVELDVAFEGGASEQDLETVTKHVAELALELVVRSRTVRLASPHL